MHRRFAGNVFAALACLAILPAVSATRTWTGASTFYDCCKMSDAANWQGNTVPAPGDSLIFPTIASSDAKVLVDVPNPTFESLTFTGSTQYMFQGPNHFTLTGSAPVQILGSAGAWMFGTGIAFTGQSLQLDIRAKLGLSTPATFSGGTLRVALSDAALGLSGALETGTAASPTSTSIVITGSGHAELIDCFVSGDVSSEVPLQATCANARSLTARELTFGRSYAGPIDLRGPVGTPSSVPQVWHVGGEAKQTGAVKFSGPLTIDLAAGGSSLRLDGPIEGSGALTLKGSGQLWVTRPGTANFAAGITVNDSVTLHLSPGVMDYADINLMGNAAALNTDGQKAAIHSLDCNGRVELAVGSSEITTQAPSTLRPVCGLFLSVPFSYTPPASGEIVLMRSSTPFTGVFRNMAEGDIVPVNGRETKLTYRGGPGGNDITLVLTGMNTPGASVNALDGPLSLSTNATAQLPFRVRVLDGNGQAVYGTIVKFSSSCGTFQGNSTNSTQTGTDGIARSPLFVAGSQPGTCAVTATLVQTGATAKFNVLIYRTADLIVEAVTPAVAVEPGKAFSVSFRASAGTPVPGIPLTFAVVSTVSATATPAFTPYVVLTDANGVARADFIANSTAGTYRITASYLGAAGSVTVNQGAPSQTAAAWIELVIDFPQWMVGGDSMANPFTVRVLDQRNGRLVNGDVVFAAKNGCGLFAGATSVRVTAIDGLARSPLFTAVQPGACDLTASLPGTPLTITFRVRIFLLSDLKLTLGPDPLVVMTHQPFNATLDARLPDGTRVPDLKVHVATSAIGSGYATLDNSFVTSRSDGAVTFTGKGGDNVGQFEVLASYRDRIVWLVANQYAAVTGVSYQGLWWKSPAGSESGWGLNLAQQGDKLFATWFTYDFDGTPMWIVMSDGVRTGPAKFEGALYRTTGPMYSALPWDPKQVHATEVGRATLEFSNIDNGTFSYTLFGISQSKPITRQQFSTPMPGCTVGGAPGATANFQGLYWHNPPGSQSGWGLNVAQQGDTIFLTWFTYDASGKATWFAVPAAARLASNLFRGRMYSTTGPAFNAVPWDPAKVKVIDAGKATFNLGVREGDVGVFTPDFGDTGKWAGGGEIVRQNFASPATVCRTD